MENKLNLPPFIVPEKVLYIKRWTLSLVMIYPPANIEVVLTASFIFQGEWHFRIKGYEYAKDGGDQWFHFEDFVKKQEQPMPLMTFSQIKEKEKEEILLNN